MGFACITTHVSYRFDFSRSQYASRYLLCCEGLNSVQGCLTIPCFERVFKEFGIPQAIRTDNGAPFASPNALFGLSKLSVWWLRLGIRIERIKPGKPQQNGRHERMHLTLKKEATKPPSFNFIQQQVRFDQFIEHFNHERPHQGIGMKCPGELYVPSNRPCSKPDVPEYPTHDKTVQVTHCGRICIAGRKINLSVVCSGIVNLAT